MNPTEKKYLRERIRQIESDKRKAISSDKPVKDEFFKKWLKLKSNKELLELIRNKLKDVYVHSYSERLNDITIDATLCYENFTYVSNEWRIEIDNYESQEKERLKKLDDYVTRLSDDLMLGSSEEALKYLKEFAEKEF